jgi:phosphoribosylaminoimidazole carboxylase PurE protein
MPKVLILLGSESDKSYGDECLEQLTVFGVEGKIEISSAHRKPVRTAALATEAEGQGFEVIIAMAGLSAALPGVAAAHSTLPVIAVPLPAALGGMDALLASVQMPPGIPVATVSIGSPGAKNAAVLAARILALKYPQVKAALTRHREGL